MIGGLKKTASAFAIAAAAGLMSTSAFAADLGGNCCADLEERVAELEATTARKGNRVVSLEVSGHINEAIVYWDDGVNSGARVVTSNYSRSRFRFKGSAKINAEWSAGFLLEIGARQTGNSGSTKQDARAVQGLDVRHEALYIDSKRLGRIWLGHTSDANDGIIDICLGCTITSSPESGLGWYGYFATSGNANTGVSFFDLGIGDTGHYGGRRNVLRYISPVVAGFTLSSSWGDANDGDYRNGPPLQEHGYIWDIALRYANEFNGVRLAAGVGYTDREYNDTSSWAGSASIAHVATGLYIQGAFSHKDRVIADDDMWSVQVGLGRKFSPLGKTTFWVQYQEYDNGANSGTSQNVGANNPVNWTGSSAQIISFGINQKIDAAAMELYLTYWNVQADVDGFGETGATPADLSINDLNIVMAGARIRF